MEKLIDKTYKSYDYFSRYTPFPYYYNTVDKKYVQGTTAQLSTTTSYVLHKVKAGDSLDSLALDYYNNPTFFWVIADFNRIQDPYIKLKIDSQIKIPTINSVTYDL